MDFQLTPEQQRLQNKCRELAAEFATSSATHDRDASHPIENYDRLGEEGLLAVTVGKEWGGSGASFLDHTIAYEALGQGCPSTALAFNMHASVIMPLLESAEVAAETKRRIADLVVHERKLIAGNFSEPVTTSLIGERPLKARARRADGGYRVTGRKMFASMLEAADFVLVMAYPDSSTSPFAGIILLVPGEAEGRSVDPNWDVLGMRATRSDSLILDECFLPDSAAVYRSDDIRPFRHAYLNWFWGSYTPVYLGIAQAAFDEIRRVVHARQPEGYAQPLAYHPDVRRHVATMSAQLEAARAFAVLHGAGNGLLTIAKGTVPLAIFGPVGYGLRGGIFGAPARATQAASPLLFGLLMDRMGVGALAISAGLSLSALVAL